MSKRVDYVSGSACTDTPSWTDGNTPNAETCEDYRMGPLCRNGVTITTIMGSEFNYPEKNCCGCGKNQQLGQICQDGSSKELCKEIKDFGGCNLDLQIYGGTWGYQYMCQKTCGCICDLFDYTCLYPHLRCNGNCKSDECGIC